MKPPEDLLPDHLGTGRPPRVPAFADHPVVTAQALRKVYTGGRTAVDGVDFAVRTGESFGILGPNGAGKSTTMRMLGCVTDPSGGTLQVLGLDAATQGKQIRRRLGVVPQADTLDAELTVKDNIVIYGRYFDLPRREASRRADSLLDFVELRDRAGEMVQTLSGGMKRRLALARALVSHPDLLLLDEPTTGLDPQARHLVWDLLDRLKRRGTTVVVTTHFMDEAERLCDRLVFMERGRFILQGAPRDLVREHVGREVLELLFLEPVDDERLGEIRAVVADTALFAEKASDRVVVATMDAARALTVLESAGVQPSGTFVRRSSLEDVFLRFTGRRIRDDS